MEDDWHPTSNATLDDHPVDVGMLMFKKQSASESGNPAYAAMGWIGSVICACSYIIN